MIKGKTKSGFKYTLKDDYQKSWRLVRTLGKMAKLEMPDENAVAEEMTQKHAEIMDCTEKVALSVLGEKQFEALIDHVEKKYGVDDVEVISSEIMEIITNGKEGKNL